MLPRCKKGSISHSTFTVYTHLKLFGNDVYDSAHHKRSEGLHSGHKYKKCEKSEEQEQACSLKMCQEHQCALLPSADRSINLSFVLLLKLERHQSIRQFKILHCQFLFFHPNFELFVRYFKAVHFLRISSIEEYRSLYLYMFDRNTLCATQNHLFQRIK